MREQTKQQVGSSGKINFWQKTKILIALTIYFITSKGNEVYVQRCQAESESKSSKFHQNLEFFVSFCYVQSHLSFATIRWRWFGVRQSQIWLLLASKSKLSYVSQASSLVNLPVRSQKFVRTGSSMLSSSEHSKQGLLKTFSDWRTRLENVAILQDWWIGRNLLMQSSRSTKKKQRNTSTTICQDDWISAIFNESCVLQHQSKLRKNCNWL